MKFLTSLIFLVACSLVSFSQTKKSLNITRTSDAPKIDGILDDAVWINTLEAATDFTQFRPEMGLAEKAHQKTIVKITYDDNAIYVGAYLKDNPKDIQKQFTSRDNFGASDFFILVLNPNNDAQNDTEFVVFSSGTQADAIASPSIGEDFGWNAVWDSAVNIVSDGWIVEMKIPYRALRFSNDAVQTWGLQLHRRFRLDNSQYSWNPIDRTKGNIGIYHGELTGIENIEPPTRLSFYPFVSGVTTSFDGETETDLNIGLDLKYGITENFTLDATLIPDFSQAGFDNRRLNLGPFEQTFSEQRQFFTEGVDLFNKGNLFFSRRIGNAPTGDPDLNADEELSDYPDEVKTLNALKVSGRTKKGLGVGFFNAITAKTEAKIKNTATNDIRKEVVEPISNYNILVIDQQFGGNSSVSLINTNVTRDGHFRDANVTGALFDISNKANKYNYSGQVKMSNVNEEGNMETGFSSRLGFAKISGNYRFSIGHNFADKKYDINDLGLLFRNNYNNIFANVSYRIFEPTEKLNSFSVYFFADYNNLYKPGRYTGNNIGLSVNGQTKKLFWFGGNINGSIGKQHDYFDPRDSENNRYFTYKNSLQTYGWLETDSNKTLSLEADLSMGTLFDKERDHFRYSFEVEPTLRLNDKFRMSYEYEYQNSKGSRGWVAALDDDIIYGERDQVTLENSISGSYNFNPLHALTLSFRNYWTTVNYDEDLFTLLENGKLSNDGAYTVTQFQENPDLDDPNVNFSTWNLDLRYSWQFAPGSQIIALYRNQLFNSDTASSDTYFDSLGTLFDQPIEHAFSLRFIYFIDYNNLKGIFKNKSNS